MPISEHQLKRYIIYTCKKCGWKTAVLSDWADLRPSRCLGKKCKGKTYFPKNPELLDISRPEDRRPAPKKAPPAVKRQPALPVEAAFLPEEDKILKVDDLTNLDFSEINKEAIKLAKEEKSERQGKRSRKSRKKENSVSRKDS